MKNDADKEMHVFAKKGENFMISPEGLQKMLQKQKDARFPGRHVSWTDDIRVQLPIRVASEGTASLLPTTLITEFKRIISIHASTPALSVKRKGKWITYSFLDYFNYCKTFAAGLIAKGFGEYTSVNIIGFNAPEWAISFFGTLFAHSVATGIYTTNSVQICQYIVDNSDCQVVVAQNMGYANKYLPKLKEGKVKLIILYNDPEAKIAQYEGKIMQWEDFMLQGMRVDNKYVEKRMNKAQPGNCATLVYTSGTTGMPKGVMLSHDNLTWTKKSMDQYYQRDDERMRLVSYLPLSHVAGLFADLVTPLMNAYHVYFAQPDALQGSLIQTLVQVRPNAFFSVPRVWEKINDKMKIVAQQNGWLKTKIATWAKNIGPAGTLKQVRKEDPGFEFKIAKALVFNQVKKKLGLDQCQFFLYGAAPLDPVIRQYFLSLNIFLINTYGMSQSTGPQNFTNPYAFDNSTLKGFREVGSSIPGTQLKIIKLDEKEEDGEICFRGRNIFMGYYKKPQETSQTLDAQGYLHSGDMGVITQNNVLFITGRAKELIITAGGQNIPPVLIQNQIKSAMPYLANVMVVGEGRKFLTCLIALKEDPPQSGKIEKSARQYLELKGISVSTIEDARKNDKFRRLVMDDLKIANDKAVSRAQNVQGFYLLPEDFSVENGQLTPTLKLKRKEVSKKYVNEIQMMYVNSKL